MGYDDLEDLDEMAGYFEEEDEDEEAGGEEEEYIIIEDEAGAVVAVVPADVAGRAKRRGRPLRRRRGHRARRAKGRKRPSRRSKGGSSKANAALLAKVAANSKAVGAMRSAVDALKSKSLNPMGVGSAADAAGYRPVAGATLALVSAAPGLAAWGPVAIAPAASMRVLSIVIDAIEDCAGAGAVALPGLPPGLVITQLMMAGSNLLKSAALAVPGPMFDARNPSYGYPVGVDRKADMPASTNLTLGGFWSHQQAVAASAGDLTAGLIASGVVG